MNHKRVAIAVGGTGGHIFPALALAQQLEKEGTEVLLIGGGLEENRFLESCSSSVVGVAASTPSKGWLQAVPKLLKGIWQSFWALRRFSPDLVVGFGSYHAFPPLFAARLRRVPIVLHEANCTPGRVTRLFSRSARVTAIHHPPTGEKLTTRTVLTAPLLRSGFVKPIEPKQDFRKALGLHPDKFTFLVFGGSQGSLALNLMCSLALTQHLGEHAKQFQVIHLTGDPSLVDTIRSEYDEYEIPAVVRPFEPHMEQLWPAADLVIARSGASTMSELLEFETPAILVPFPFATDGHQEANANFVSADVRGAVKLREGDLNAETLSAAIRRLIGDERQELRSLEARLKEHKERQPTRSVASLVCETIGTKWR